MSYREYLDDAIAHYQDEMPRHVRAAIADATNILFTGPSGYGAAFREALEIIREYTDTIEDVSVETYYDEDTGESEYERVDGSAAQIVRALVGREMYTYL